MDENPGASEPEEQTAQTRRLSELSYGHRRGDWPDPLREPYEPAQDVAGPGVHGVLALHPGQSGGQQDLIVPLCHVSNTAR
jgi:hypothetical protein